MKESLKEIFKTKNNIYMTIGIIGIILIIIGIFLPFTVGYYFDGSEIVSSFMNTLGSLALILAIGALVICILSLPKLVLIIILCILALAITEFVIEMLNAYEMTSPYKSMYAGAGFIMICIGSVMTIIYSFLFKKEKVKKEKKKKKEGPAVISKENIMQHSIQRLQLDEENKDENSNDYNFPQELKSEEERVEENTIQLFTPEESIKTYDNNFDIVKMTAETIGKNEKHEEVIQAPIIEQGDWDIPSLDAINLPIYTTPTTNVVKENKTTDEDLEIIDEEILESDDKSNKENNEDIEVLDI